jgi:peptidoglycan/xylan/chitin deacetylase (PgdA/CDA1 family)
MKKIILVLLLLVVTLPLFAQNVQNKVITVGSGRNKLIALSFDDGPGLNTEEILKILDEKEVKATFFMLGSSIEKKPDLLKEVYSKGHEIANHTYNHINFFKYKKEDKKEKLETELLQTQDLIKSIIDYETKLVRYPYGYSAEDALEVAEKNNYKVINWTFGIDWKKLSKEEMLEQYLANIKSGYIFLMHDLPKNSKVTEILPILIDEAKKKNYKFVTVSEIISKTKQ